MKKAIHWILPWLSFVSTGCDPIGDPPESVSVLISTPPELSWDYPGNVAYASITTSDTLIASVPRQGCNSNGKGDFTPYSSPLLLDMQENVVEPVEGDLAYISFSFSKGTGCGAGIASGEFVWPAEGTTLDVELYW